MGMFRPTRPPFPPPEPEIIYVPGPQGPQGPQGDKGDKGDTGPMGPKGEQGIQGIKGDTGERGPIGPSGERGDVGEKGAKGQKGDKGDKGETGPQGIQGPKGDKGDTGDRGPRGYVGPQGQDGADGADGAKGEKGDKGDRGERGYTGQQGPKGDTGERGPIGIQGQRGPKGDTGNIGPQGPKGDKGEKGDKGDPGSGSDTNAVHYTTDTGKTSSEKEQARANIGAQEAISATGFLSRDALGNISGVESQAITSYETLPVSMGGTGSNTADGARQSIGAVKEPLSEGTNGQFLSTDGNGGRIWKTVDLAAYRTSAAQDVIDATKQTKITASGILQGDGSGGVTAKAVDSTATASSTNLITSGAVYSGLEGKVSNTEYAPDAKTAGMTQAVGKDSSGKLWTTPGGGGGGSDISLGITNATVGQFPKVSAVDSDGKPTAWAPESLLYTLTVTCVTQDGVTVTGQTVTVRAGSATGQVYATAAYNGQPVSFSVPKGFAYFVSVSDTLASHFNPTTATGAVNNADVSATLTYSDFSTIRTFPDIKAALNAGTDLTELVGEQVTCTRNGATLTWDVADYDDTNKEITLLLHDTLPDNMQFEPQQALAWFESGLSAGNYYFKQGSTNYYFTIATAIPEGGQIRATTSTFTTYSSQESTVSLESGTVSTTAIEGATSIGTAAQGDLNHMDRVNSGSNNFGESFMFQFLNSNVAPNTFIHGVTKFCRPNSAGSFGGLLYNFDSEALAVIEDTVWRCSANTVYEAPASVGGICLKNAPYTVTAKFALASQMEIFGSYDGVQAGDSVFDLYRTATQTDRIKRYNGSARYWWIRSPYPSIANFVRFVNTSGGMSSINARGSYGCVPACKIRKST